MKRGDFSSGVNHYGSRELRSFERFTNRAIDVGRNLDFPLSPFLESSDLLNRLFLINGDQDNVLGVKTIDGFNELR